jgi:LysM repeat protein
MNGQALNPTPLQPRITITPAPAGPTPTPNQPSLLPTLRAQTDEYTVVSGDSLARIALRHQVSVGQILSANPDLKDPNLIEPGQKLIISACQRERAGDQFQDNPRRGTVLQPSAVGFDTFAVTAQFAGKLSSFSETLEDETTLGGAEIVQRVADEFSVNPRLLLAVLEYRSGWVSSAGKTGISEDYPLGLKDANRKGLYKQLSWAANEMTRGYTLWENSAVAVWTLSERRRDARGCDHQRRHSRPAIPFQPSDGQRGVEAGGIPAGFYSDYNGCLVSHSRFQLSRWYPKT